MPLIVSTEAEQTLARIAENDGVWAQREVAHICVNLEQLEFKFAQARLFWNVQGAATGNLVSYTTLPNGKPIWRLCPTHVHCIALLVVQEDDLLVLEVCNRAEINAVERQLIADCC
jgi:hypothetical protein